MEVTYLNVTKKLNNLISKYGPNISSVILDPLEFDRFREELRETGRAFTGLEKKLFYNEILIRKREGGCSCG